MIVVLSGTTLAAAITGSGFGFLDPSDALRDLQDARLATVFDNSTRDLVKTDDLVRLPLYESLSRLGSTDLDPSVPVDSALLGVTVPASLLPSLYQARALAFDKPLRAALEDWRTWTGLTDPPEVLATQLPNADALDLDLQQVTAILLYALIDATVLQNRALDELTNDDIRFLNDHLADLRPIDDDVTVDDQQAAALERFVSTVERVDLGKIIDGARIIAATTSSLLPQLETMRESHSRATSRLQPVADQVDAFQAAFVLSEDPTEAAAQTLDYVTGYVRILASAAGMNLPSLPRPAPLDKEDSLASAVASIAALTGDPLELSTTALSSSTQALPVPLQAAITRILRAEEAVLQLQVNQLTDPPSPTDMLLSYVRLIETVKAVYPTLKFYHYALQFSGPVLPKSVDNVGQSVETVRLLTQMMGDAGTPLADVVSMTSFLQGQAIARPKWNPDLAPGSLGRSVVRMYDSLGVPHDAALDASLENATSQLQPEVERAAARILQAQLHATTELTRVRANFTEAQHAGLVDLPQNMRDLFEKPMITYQELAAIEPGLQAAQALQAPLMQGAILIADALDQAESELTSAGFYGTSSSSSRTDPFGVPLPDGDGDPDPEDGSGDGPEAPGAPVPMSSSSTAAPSSPVGCTDLPAFSDCAGSDILFMDPVVRWVIITGKGSTSYHPTLLGVRARCGATSTDTFTCNGRDQMLSIDLGGDDVYQTGAAAASATATATGMVTAVLLEMGGNDQYLAPPLGLPQENLQAAAGGGIAFLSDLSGNDVYRAGSPASPVGTSGAQAHALTGYAVLNDESGNDFFSNLQVNGQGSAITGGTALFLNRESGEAVGDDSYQYIAPNFAQFGNAQAFAQLGTAIFIDETGDDTYRGGRQGGTASVALALFADLAGTDTHWKRRYDGSGTVKNGECETGVLVAANIENPTATQPTQQLAIFIDLKPDGSCDPRSPLLLAGVVDMPNPDEFIATLNQVIEDADDGDSDHDLWPTALETLFGTDGENRTSYPAGAPQKPEAWDQVPGAPSYPFDGVGGDFPYGSALIVEIPMVLAVGDVGQNTYTKNYRLSIDLGGKDTYRNLVGSAFANPKAPAGPLFTYFSMHLDVGTTDDTYDGGAQTQGAGGILIDFGGDDSYEAATESQGAAYNPNKVGDTTGYLVPSVGWLIDVLGNDIYEAGAQSQGFAETWILNAAGAVSSDSFRFGLLLDAQGDDMYKTPLQASITSTLSDVPRLVVASFQDLDGVDHYNVNAHAPIPGQPGTPGVTQTRSSPMCLYWTEFFDSSGYDTYEDFAGVGLSHVRNDRTDFAATERVYVTTTGLTTTALVVGSLRHDSDQLARLRSEGFAIAEDPQDFALHLPGHAIAIGNPGPTEYYNAFVLSLDLNGNDAYFNNAGATLVSPGPETTVGAGNPASQTATVYLDDPRSFAGLVIDAAGDDTYDDRPWLRSWSGSFNPNANPALPTVGTPPSPNPAAEFPGTGSSRDFVRMVSQATGYLGAGFLIDQQGLDSYRAARFAQGVGISGVGILWDREGDDRYAFDADVVAAPQASGQIVTWMDQRNGRWDVFTLDRRIVGAGPAQVVAVTPALREGLFRGEHQFPVVEDGRLVWMAQFNGDWNLYWRRAAGAVPVPMLRDLLGGTLGPAWEQSNQMFPRLSGTSMVYLDDRTGVNDVYFMDGLDQAFPPEPRVVSSSPTAAKRDPDISGNFVVWSQLNQATNRWNIHFVDLNTGQEGVIPPSPNVGDRLRPRVHEGLIVYQEYHSGRGDWDVGAFNLAIKAPVNGVHGAGDQFEPDVNAQMIAWTDVRDAVARVELRFRDGRPSCTYSRPTWNDHSPTLDSARNFDAYHLDQPAPGTRADAFPVLLARSAAQCTQSSLVNNPAAEQSARFLQGVSLQRGLGLLLEESGHDNYHAWDHAQGDVYTVGTPNPGPFSGSKPTGPPSDGPSQVQRGYLIDLDGHDSYLARDFAQGVHATAFLHNVVQTPGMPPTYWSEQAFSEHEGIFFDERGNDKFNARTRSQGMSALAVAMYVQCAGNQCDDGHAHDYSPILLKSTGIFADTGGTDLYTYQGATTARLQLDGLEPDCTQLGNMGLAAAQPTVCLVTNTFNDTINPLLGDTLGAIVEIYNEQFPPDPVGRNNRVWRQSSVGQGDVPRTTPRIGAAVHPAGLGIDVGVYEKIGDRVSEQLAEFVTVGVAAADPAGTPYDEEDPADDDIVLTAEVTNGAGFRIISVEYFAENPTTGSRFLGFGNNVNCGFCLTWPTAFEAWPDGSYIVTGRANLATAVGLGSSVGYVEGSRDVIVDNPSRITDAAASTDGFSPRPFPNLASDPDGVNVAFRVSRTNDFTAGHVTVLLLGADRAPIRELFNDEVANPLGLPDVAMDVRWDGTKNDGTIADRGDYILRVEATDDENRPDRMDDVEFPVHIDATAPGLTCVRMASITCNSSGLLGRLDGTISQSGGQDVSTIQVAWDHPALKDPTEVRRFHVFTCRAQILPCPTNAWTPDGTVDGATDRSRQYQVVHQDTLSVLVLSEDIFGNLEDGIDANGDLRATVADAFSVKRLRGDFLQLKVDLVNPTAELAVRVGDEVFDSAAPILVSRSTAARVTATVNETSSLPLEGQLFFFSAAGQVLVVPLEGPTVISGQPTDFKFESAPWNEVVPASWTSGTIAYFLLFTDAAGNARDFSGFLLFDADAPFLVPEGPDVPPRVIYPDGHATVESIGESVDLLVRARDPCNPHCTPTQQLQVFVDASQVNSTDGWQAMRFRPPGTHTLRIRIDEAIPTQATIIQLPVRIVDAAGNEDFDVIRLAVGTPQFGISPAEVAATHNQLTFDWTTNDPVQGFLRFGTTRGLGTTVTSTSADGTTHQVIIPDLQGATTYWYQLGAVDANNIVETTDLASTTTTLGLRGALLAPISTGLAFGEPFNVVFSGEMLSNQAAPLDFEISIREPTSSNLIATARLPGASQGEHEVQIDPAEFSDGEWIVHVDVDFGFENVFDESPVVVFDRRAPHVNPIQPAPGTVLLDAAATLRVRILDSPSSLGAAGSGVDPSTILVTLNAESLAVPEGSYDNQVLVLEGIALNPGTNTVVVSASDAAGNQATATWSFILDAQPPHLATPKLELPAGQTKAKPGDVIAIQIDVEDDSNIHRVWAQSDAAPTVPRIGLSARPGGRFVGTFIPEPPSTANADLERIETVRVWAEDANGFVTETPVTTTFSYDAAPPTLKFANATPISASETDVLLTASEHSCFDVQAEGAIVVHETVPCGDTVRILLRAVATPPPSYRLIITLLDGANNTATIRETVATSIAEDATAPVLPKALKATTLLDGRIRLMWEPATDELGIAGYAVYRRLDGTAFRQIATTIATEHEDRPPTSRLAEYYVVSHDYARLPSAPTNTVAVEPKFTIELRDPRFDPPMGRSSDPFRVEVTVLSPGGVDPNWVRVYVGGMPYPMHPVSNEACPAVCVYKASVRLPPVDVRTGPTIFSVEALVDGIVIRPAGAEAGFPGPVVLQSFSASDESEGAAPIAAAAPAPGASVLLLLVAMAITQRLLMRNRRFSQ